MRPKIFKVKNLNEAIRILPIMHIRNTIIYFIVYHPKLSIWQNILANTCFCIIKEDRR